MLALKLTGAVLVCLCGFFIGYKKAQNCSLRASTLELMTLFLSDIRAAIKYRRENAICLLCTISQTEKYRSLNLNMQEVDAPEWPLQRQKALQGIEEKFNTYIPECEMKLFCDAISTVGESNALQEDEKLEFYLHKLAECAQCAKELSIKNKKLYMGIGLFAGASAAIILL